MRSGLRILLVVVAAMPVLWSQPEPTDIGNAATIGLGRSGMPRGGALATLFCYGLSGDPGIVTASTTTPLPFELGGVQVTVNGALAPILAVVIPGSPAKLGKSTFRFR